MKILINLIVCVMLLIACSEAPPEHVSLEFRAASPEPAEGLAEMKTEGSNEVFYLHNEVLLSNADVESARVTQGQYGPQIELVLTAAGGTKFAEATKNNIDKNIGMVIDGKLMSAPLVRREITDGRAIVIGKWTEKEADRIALGILVEK
ncbi:hypothetical protein ACFL6L_00195 [candidate division KSB1 bacterium]